MPVEGLKKRREFRRVYEQGQKVRGAHLVVFATKHRGDVSRFGITATRHLGGAVVRNRARRRVRELFRRHREAWGDLRVEAVVNCRAGCAGAPWRELESDFLRCVELLKQRLGPRES